MIAQYLLRPTDLEVVLWYQHQQMDYSILINKWHLLRNSFKFYKNWLVK